MLLNRPNPLTHCLDLPLYLSDPAVLIRVIFNRLCAFQYCLRLRKEHVRLRDVPLLCSSVTARMHQVLASFR